MSKVVENDAENEADDHESSILANVRTPKSRQTSKER